MNETLLNVISGGLALFLALAMTYREKSADDEQTVSVSPVTFLQGFIIPPAIASMAGGLRGTVTYQISGGREPEYETELVRQVSDAERWQAFSQTNAQLQLSVFIVSIASFWFIPWLARKPIGKKFGTWEARLSSMLIAGFLFFVFIQNGVQRP